MLLLRLRQLRQLRLLQVMVGVRRSADDDAAAAALVDDAAPLARATPMVTLAWKQPACLLAKRVRSQVASILAGGLDLQIARGRRGGRRCVLVRALRHKQPRASEKKGAGDQQKPRRMRM